MKQREIKRGRYYLGESGQVRLVKAIDWGRVWYWAMCPEQRWAYPCPTLSTFARWAQAEVRPTWERVER